MGFFESCAGLAHLDLLFIQLEDMVDDTKLAQSCVKCLRQEKGEFLDLCSAVNQPWYLSRCPGNAGT